LIMKPKRIQLKRVKGWKMPPNTVKVDRTSIWGNPHIPKGPYSVNAAVMDYKCDILVAMILASRGGPEKPKPYAARITERLSELNGKNLACWCKSSPCHADVLLELVNS
jgi:hypothetical protein